MGTISIIFTISIFHFVLNVHGGIDSTNTSACSCQTPPIKPPPLGHSHHPVQPSPPPPPPPHEPSASDFQDYRLFKAYKVIQRLKCYVTDDPKGITKTWRGADICGKYKGFYCASPPDNKSAITISSIDFNQFNLSIKSLDPIPNFPDLAIFHANTNRIKGTIPLTFSKLPYLYELDVSNNQLSGTFPSTVLAMPNLIFLDIRFNAFTGTVPAELFRKSLQVLFLNNNNFTQPIPDTLGNSQTAYLTFANNQFSGFIPPTIGNLTRTLIEVLFLNNHLRGCLPYEIGRLTEATVFDAGFNRLSGPIPESFGCLARMEQLNLAGNCLYGKIPEVVCALGRLKNLSLSGNYFNAEGPVCEHLAGKGVLHDRNNCIPGRPNQRSPAECAAFYSKPKVCSNTPSFHHVPPCKLPLLDTHWLESSSTYSPSYSALSPYNN